jgi:hypothetical protein
VDVISHGIDRDGKATFISKDAATPTQFMSAVTGIYGSTSKVYGVIGGHSGEPLKGALLQVIAFNSILSSGDRTAIWNWIIGKYPSIVKIWSFTARNGERPR